ncbi:MAG: NAD-binding protein, partial [Gemmatimonadota bacterium]
SFPAYRAFMLMVAVLMFVLRPLGVALSTYGSTLTWQERGFIAWLGPRGIVAAAVASLFAERLPEQQGAAGTDLRALVFLVIATTVVVQGLSGGFIARLLGVRRARRSGYLIVGANAIGRALAHALQGGGEDVMLIDTNAVETRTAEREGLRVIFGNANDEGPLSRADVNDRFGYIAATPNPAVNVLLASRAHEMFRVPHSYAALQRGRTGAQPQQVHEAGAAVLFGRPVDLETWRHHLSQGMAVVRHWRYGGRRKASIPHVEADAQTSSPGGYLPLAITRDGRTLPVDDGTRAKPGDVVTFLCHGEAASMRARVEPDGWEELPASDSEPVELATV